MPDFSAIVKNRQKIGNGSALKLLLRFTGQLKGSRSGGGKKCGGKGMLKCLSRGFVVRHEGLNRTRPKKF
jgi:hypothetical protein